jgi:subtilisin-like proprotein convertase family protein
MFATPYIIGVASLQAKSSGYTMSPLSTYSTPGSSVWVSGFGGESGASDPAMMTVDQSSCSKGYVRTGNASSNAFNNQGNHSSNTSCNYTSTFNGTSSAAPTVSGVVALMLDANENLTWRDVKHILASTSTKIDASRSKTESGITQYEWETNAAGYEFHNWYGFGQINASSAVSAALNYSAGSLGTFVYAYAINSTDVTISCCTNVTSSAAISAPAGSSGIVEFVRIGISVSHGDPEELGIRLLSPSGTVVNLLTPFHRATTDPNYVWFEIGANAFYGESMGGTWTIALNDYVNDGDSGTLNSWDIKVYGH